MLAFPESEVRVLRATKKKKNLMLNPPPCTGMKTLLAFSESEVRVLRAMMMRAIALARQVAREGEGREGARGRGGGRESEREGED